MSHYLFFSRARYKTYLLFFLSVFVASPSFASDTAQFTLESLMSHIQQSYRATETVEFALNAQLVTQVGEGDDAKLGQADIYLTVKDGPDGVSIHYPEKLLSALETERKRFEKDAETVSSIRDVSNRMTVREVQSLTSAHETLLRRLRTAKLTSQASADYNGIEATKFEFELEPKFSKRDKKYIKKYQAQMTLWLSKSGAPMAAFTEFNLKGRAFFVVRFRSEEEEEIIYEEFGDRLVAISRRRYNASAGGGEYGDSTLRTTLKEIP